VGAASFRQGLRCSVTLCSRQQAKGSDSSRVRGGRWVQHAFEGVGQQGRRAAPLYLAVWHLGVKGGRGKVLRDKAVWEAGCCWEVETHRAFIYSGCQLLSSDLRPAHHQPTCTCGSPCVHGCMLKSQSTHFLRSGGQPQYVFLCVPLHRRHPTAHVTAVVCGSQLALWGAV
jgi:hypothetical protein